jgi:osmotically-inducible protein OsmY
MPTDFDIKRDVEAELRWSPEFDERDIAIKVKDGVVLLTGFVGKYYERYQAENAVKRVRGIAGVANDIRVRPEAGHGVSDPDIVRAALSALKTALPAVAENVRVIVKQGHLALEGAVECDFQSQQAENAVRHLKGVTAVTNLVQITPRVTPADLMQRIEEAFRRSAEVDAQRISVEAHDGEVTLSGTVRSWIEREEAQQTAWSAPGVTRVTNEIRVSP